MRDNKVKKPPKPRTQRAKDLRSVGLLDVWCICPEPVESEYHPDEGGMKHHYTCRRCGKITQIG